MVGVGDRRRGSYTLCMTARERLLDSHERLIALYEDDLHDDEATEEERREAEEALVVLRAKLAAVQASPEPDRLPELPEEATEEEVAAWLDGIGRVRARDAVRVQAVGELRSATARAVTIFQAGKKSGSMTVL